MAAANRGSGFRARRRYFSRVDAVCHYSLRPAIYHPENEDRFIDHSVCETQALPTYRPHLFLLFLFLFSFATRAGASPLPSLQIYDTNGPVLQISDFRSIANTEIEFNGKKFPAVRLNNLLRHSALHGDSVIFKGDSRDVSMDWEQAVSPDLYIFFAKNGIARLYSASTKRIQSPNVIRRITVHKTPLWIKVFWYAGMALLLLGAITVFRYRESRIARAVAVFALTLCVYWQFELPNRGNGSDNIWYIPTALSILHQGNLELSEYGDMIQDANGYGIRTIHGKPYNLFPLGPSIVPLPVVFAASLIYHSVTPARAQLFYIAAFTAKVIAALSVALLFLLLLRFTNNAALTLALTALFAFATTNFGLHAGGLWSHNVSLPLLLAALLLLQTGRDKTLWLAALPLSLAYITRPTFSVHIVLISIYIFIYYRKAFLPFVALGGAIAGLFVWLSYSVYGTFLPPYYGAERAVGGAFWEAFAANMISPNRGLLVFAPFFLASFWGIFVVFRDRGKYQPFYRLLACLAVAHWIVICLTRNWWAGVTVGPRFFSDSLPVWILLLVPAFLQVQHYSIPLRRIAFTLFALAATWSLFAQYRTATSMEVHRWNSAPIPIGYKPERVWDWNDMQILRTESKRLRLQAGQRSAPPSFLLITIDTLRADHLGCYGYRKSTSPEIDRIAAQGARFQKAYSAVPLTLPSHATILSGVYPNHHGIRDNAYFNSGSTLFLQESLKRAGYQTAAFVSGAPLLSGFGLSRGFNRYDDALNGAERKADRTTEAALRWLKTAHGPFFVWIHYFDPHAEYNPPEIFRSKFENPYDGEIAFVDSQIKRLLDTVDERTYIIITGDHGESLGEHGEKTHGVFLYNATLRVPLILRGPGIQETVRDDAVSLCDIAPTVLSLAGIANKNASFDGISLLDKMKDRMLFAESLYAQRDFGYAPLFAGIRQNKKYIDAPDPEFFDVVNDPEEKENRIAKARMDVSPWIKSIGKYKAVTGTTSSSRIPPEEAEKLRSLGYVGGEQKGSRIDPKSRIGAIQNFNEGLELLKKHEYANAEATFRKITTTEPQNGSAFHFLGDALAGQEKYEQAAVAFALAYEKLKDPDIGLQLAKTYFRLGDAVHAESLLKEIVRTFKDYPAGRFQLASFYAGQNQPDEAFALLRGDSPEFQNQRGILYLMLHEPTNAVAEFSKAVQADPKAEFYSNLAIAYQQEGQLAEAEKTFVTTLGIDPDYEQAAANLAFLLIQQSRWAEAESHLLSITKRNPTLWRARMALGFVYEKQGKVEQAKNVYQAFLADAPPNEPDRAQVEARLRAL